MNERSAQLPKFDHEGWPIDPVRLSDRIIPLIDISTEQIDMLSPNAIQSSHDDKDVHRLIDQLSNWVTKCENEGIETALKEISHKKFKHPNQRNH